MSFPTVDDINTASYRLLELLKVRNKSKTPPQPQPAVRPLFGIGEPIDLTDYLVESKDITSYNTDEWNNINSISHSTDGKVYELNVQNYQFLKAIADKFLEQDDHFLVADTKFTEQEIFNWLVDVINQKRIGLTLLAFLENRLDEEIRPYTFYFKVSPIGIESEIRLADVVIFAFTETYLRSNYDKLPLDQQSNWNEYKEAFNGVINSVVAAVEVKAVDSMCNREIRMHSFWQLGVHHFWQQECTVLQRYIS